MPTLTTLVNFIGTGSDGANPIAGLIADAAGDLFGTTSQARRTATGARIFCGRTRAGRHQRDRRDGNWPTVIGGGNTNRGPTWHI